MQLGHSAWGSWRGPAAGAAPEHSMTTQDSQNWKYQVAHVVCLRYNRNGTARASSVSMSAVSTVLLYNSYNIISRTYMTYM